jgi:Domain of unknown function (DUF4429)
MSISRRMLVEGRTGQVEPLENSIRITRRGWLSTPKDGDKEILLSSITAIEFKPAGFLGKAGYIRFVYQGGGEIKKSFWEIVDPVMHAAADENAVLFGKGQQSGLERLKRAIEKELAKIVRPQAAPITSVAEELTKLAGLRCKGILTEEESFSNRNANCCSKIWSIVWHPG